MNDTPKKPVYFISDGTALTVAALGRSLLTQFEGIEFDIHTIPFIDTENKAQAFLERLQAHNSGPPPLVLHTLVDTAIIQIIEQSPGLCLSIFGAFIGPLEKHFERSSSHRMGRSHHIDLDDARYEDRIAAIHFSIQHDDGLNSNNYEKADVVLVGVSRTGKTPTSLYLSLQFGLRVANYPLTEEDLKLSRLPAELLAQQRKLAGLSTTAERLQMLRSSRLRASSYATLRRCTYEINEAEALMRNCDIPIFDSSECSIEEISTRILVQFGYEGK